jgi:hypothetical protein
VAVAVAAIQLLELVALASAALAEQEIQQLRRVTHPQQTGEAVAAVQVVMKQRMQEEAEAEVL